MSFYFHVLFSLLAWGLNVVLFKFMSDKLDSYTLSLLKISICLFLICIYMLIKHININKKYIVHNCIIGFFMFYLNNLFVMQAFQYVLGTTSSFLHSISGCIMIILSHFILKTEICKKQYLYMIMIIFSYFLSINFMSAKLNIGILWMLLGILSSSIGSILIKKYNITQSLEHLFIQMMSALLCFYVHGFIIDCDISFTSISMFYWLLLTVSSILFIYVQYIYMKSIDILGSIKTGKIYSIVPVFIFILSIIILKEEVSIYQVLAMICIIFTVIVTR